MDALDEFYKILDEIDEIAESQKNVDIEGLMGQLEEISKGLKSVEENDKQETE